MSSIKILDACCGSKMFWYDKENPFTTFMDIRELETTLCDGRKLEIKPDVIGDFTDMKFADSTFNVVVFDPPHLKQAGSESWLAKKYGVLPNDYKEYIKKGFAECFRVLKQGGILVFKWNSEQIPFSEVIKLTEYSPLFGDKRSKTRWTVFVKTSEMMKS